MEAAPREVVESVMQASDCAREVDRNGNAYCEAHWVGWLSDVNACARAERIANAAVGALGLTKETCCEATYREQEETGKYSVYTCSDLERSCRTRLVGPWSE